MAWSVDGVLVVKKSVSIMDDEEDDDCGDTIFGWMSIRMMVKKNFNLDIVKLEDDDANAKRRRLRHIPFFVTIIFISSVIACQAKRVNVVVEAIAFALTRGELVGGR